MQALLAAIETRFGVASGLATAISGGLHLGIAPAGTVAPFAVYRPVAAPVTQNYGSSGDYTEPQVDFIVRGFGANAALVLCESLIAAYKNQVLTLSSGKMVNTVLVMEPTPEPDDPNEDEHGRDTFGWVTSFRFSNT